MQLEELSLPVSQQLSWEQGRGGWPAAAVSAPCKRGWNNLLGSGYYGTWLKLDPVYEPSSALMNSMEKLMWTSVGPEFGLTCFI